MDTIYSKSVRAVEAGANFRVDFRSRSLKIDGKAVIDEGRYEGELGITPCSEEEFLSRVEELYRCYKYSVPSERSESRPRRYFTALPEKELSDEDMFYGQQRDKTQLELELYILCQILNGFAWNPERLGSWFWQSRNDKDLVLLREWVEPDNNQSINPITKLSL